jgi:hypothetical protein
MSLKGFGWETYRVRVHSIPTSIENTDTYQCAERRMSKVSILSIPNKSTSPTSNDNTSKRESIGSGTGNESRKFRFSQYQDSLLPEPKVTRSLTMPSNILLNSNEIPESRHGK